MDRTAPACEPEQRWPGRTGKGLSVLFPASGSEGLQCAGALDEYLMAVQRCRDNGSSSIGLHAEPALVGLNGRFNEPDSFSRRLSTHKRLMSMMRLYCCHADTAFAKRSPC